NLLVRTHAEPVALLGAIRGEVQKIDRALPLYNVGTVQGLIDSTLAVRRFALWLLALFAGTALVLALAGIYSVTSFGVAQRTREIGIRVALGAARADVLRLILGQGAKLAALGVGIGLAGALALTHSLKTLLYGVSPTDPATFAVVAALLLATALLACWLPARRAARVDPVAALRDE
ncbi:MAG: FtsX-like permease family protein, partial [Verrucomicrobiae bacterium]|nr:FtsX-like permease family protein [Verrucomicrobiae bacterium]